MLSLFQVFTATGEGSISWDFLTLHSGFVLLVSETAKRLADNLGVVIPRGCTLRPQGTNLKDVISKASRLLI